MKDKEKFFRKNLQELNLRLAYGRITINQARKEMGLTPIYNGDIRLIIGQSGRQ